MLKTTICYSLLKVHKRSEQKSTWVLAFIEFIIWEGWWTEIMNTSVQFSCSFMSSSFRPHGLQHTRPPVHHQLPEFTQTHVHPVGDAIQTFHLCRPLLLLPSIFPHIRVFSNESVLCIRWPKYWGFSFSINPSNEYSGLISFRMDWLDLLAVQGTLKSLLQHWVQKHQFLSTQLSSQSNSHIHTWLLEKP